MNIRLQCTSTGYEYKLVISPKKNFIMFSLLDSQVEWW
jgi:hypothetical protein